MKCLCNSYKKFNSEIEILNFMVLSLVHMVVFLFLLSNFLNQTVNEYKDSLKSYNFKICDLFFRIKSY